MLPVIIMAVLLLFFAPAAHSDYSIRSSDLCVEKYYTEEWRDNDAMSSNYPTHVAVIEQTANYGRLILVNSTIVQFCMEGTTWMHYRNGTYGHEWIKLVVDTPVIVNKYITNITQDSYFHEIDCNGDLPNGDDQGCNWVCIDTNLPFNVSINDNLFTQTPSIVSLCPFPSPPNCTSNWNYDGRIVAVMKTRCYP